MRYTVGSPGSPMMPLHPFAEMLHVGAARSGFSAPSAVGPRPENGVSPCESGTIQPWCALYVAALTEAPTAITCVAFPTSPFIVITGPPFPALRKIGFL